MRPTCKDILRLLPLALLLATGCATTDADRSSGVFPCVWSDRGFAFYPFYYEAESADRSESTHWLLCGITGWLDARGRTYAHWLVPLYVQGREDFYSLPLTRIREGRRARSTYWLGGLVAQRDAEDARGDRHWALPFYYADRDTFVTPLHGKAGDATWVLPIYYRSERWFATLLWGEKEDRSTGERAFALPLLLTLAESDARGDVALWSLPYGHCGGGTVRTNTWWATPLVGTRAGRREGWWTFPLVDVSADPLFDARVASVGEQTIPAAVSFVPGEVTDSLGGRVAATLQRGSVATARERTYLLCLDDDDVVTDEFREAEGRYRVVRRRKIGNRLLFNLERCHEVVYDVASRWKISDEERLSIDFLTIPLWW